MRLYIIAFSFLSKSFIYSQTIDNPKEVYNHTEIYIDLLESQCRNLILDSIKQKTLYLENLIITTDNLPDSILGFEIVVLNDKQLKKLLKKKKKLQLTRLIPIRFERKKLYATLLNFTVTCKKGTLHYINKGGGSVNLLQKNDRLYYYWRDTQN